jgi:hypothetical protein
MGRNAGLRRRGIVLAGALALLLALLAGCGEEASTPTASTVSQGTQPGAPADLPPLAPELVGAWSVSDTSGPQQIAREYIFAADGRYQYSLGTCQGSSDCTLVSRESGFAQAAGGILSLRPQTEPNDGARDVPYAVVQDPLGDQLQLRLPDGQVDVFYRG